MIELSSQRFDSNNGEKGVYIRVLSPVETQKLIASYYINDSV